MADPQLAAYAQSIELASVAAYQTLAPALSADLAPVGTLFAQHHQDHANAFAGVAAEAATGIPNRTLVATLGLTLRDRTDQTAALEFAFDLENQLAATYAWMLTLVESPDVARLVAAVLSVQSAHGCVLGVELDKPVGDLYPSGALLTATVGDGTDNAQGFDPARFPVG